MKKPSNLPNWLRNLWIEQSLEMELHDIYTKIDLDAQLYNQCKHKVNTNKYQYIVIVKY